MIASLAVTAGLLLQAAGNRTNPARAKPCADPCGSGGPDSTVYVTLRQPGNLLVLHVDAIGRIQVLSPRSPDDAAAWLAKRPRSFDPPATVPAERNPATFVAVRSRWAFEFAAAAGGFCVNYNDALLLQPTAGDPLGGLLDIADRVTDGRSVRLRRGHLFSRGYRGGARAGRPAAVCSELRCGGPTSSCCCRGADECRRLRRTHH